MFNTLFIIQNTGLLFEQLVLTLKIVKKCKLVFRRKKYICNLCRNVRKLIDNLKFTFHMALLMVRLTMDKDRLTVF